MKQVIERIRNEHQLFFTYETSPMSDDMKRYSEFYNLPINEVVYHYGYEKMGAESLFIQSFKPATVIAHVLLLHGYYDHTGIFSSTIQHLTERNFHVMSFDLPGHGLSTGERAAVTEFSLYGDSVREVVQKYLSTSSLPLYVVAHSTGGAAAVDYFLSHSGQLHVKKAVLVCPLIRSYRWHTTTLGMKPLKIFKQQLKRVFRMNSSDPTFLEFVKADPLQHDHLPISWIEALINWNEVIKEKKPCPLPLYVLQGEQDTTVDWHYNTDFLMKKFPNVDIALVVDGKHHLLNEIEPIRNIVNSLIVKYLSD